MHQRTILDEQTSKLIFYSNLEVLTVTVNGRPLDSSSSRTVHVNT